MRFRQQQTGSDDVLLGAVDFDERSQERQESNEVEEACSPKTVRKVESGQAKKSPATWLASKLTPNRISKIDSDGELEFRQLRARTIVTAKGKQVSSNPFFQWLKLLL